MLHTLRLLERRTPSLLNAGVKSVGSLPHCRNDVRTLRGGRAALHRLARGIDPRNARTGRRSHVYQSNGARMADRELEPGILFARACSNRWQLPSNARIAQRAIASNCGS